ncbi:hypothetical protein SAMN04488570_2420 [Nocardioides scoriae]|uniref:Uncharacterized protein n=1 Tax=Nocardioides scoriae TaxID=642780 RepID=A0A1H1U5H8_9ACTN|nr:hypothetical protein SAMN04488570_2420 [Nocardioides scoriae]
MLIVFVLVVGSRFLVPLLIPRFPLPAIVASLVLDAVDQTVFQSLGYDPPGYQGYDKATDVYYLAIAYLATMRNWESLPAFRVARFLYFYRLVGVVAFELLQARPLLLLFPNTFEYFFIAYEVVRSRWWPRRWELRWWIGVAALIWVVVKLPQEWWIHVAQLDVTDALAEHAWAPPLLVALLAVAAAGSWWGVRPRLPEPDWSWRVRADPMPEEMDTPQEQFDWQARWGAIRSWATLEKVVLIGLISVVYGQVLPGVRSTSLQLFIGVGVVVVINAGLTLLLVRRSWTIESTGWAFLARVAVNVVMVVVADWLLNVRGGNIDGFDTVFFLSLISLVTTLHDRYRPVLATRVVAERRRAAGAAPA